MDEIQQKIEDFQKQLLPREFLLKQTILSNPAVLPAVGFIVGLTLQYYFQLPLLIWFGILFSSLVLYILQKFFGKINLLSISVSLCFVCLGGIRLLNYNTPAANDIRNIAPENFTFAHIKAQIVSEPRIVTADQNDWLFSKYSYSYPYTTFYAKVTEIKTDTGWQKAAGKIKFYISQEANLNLGDYFQTFCRLEKFSSADNPGQFDTAKYMNRNSVFISASVKSLNSLTIEGYKKIKSPFDIKAKFQKIVIEALNGDIEPDNNARLVEAMLLGSRTKIDKKLYNDFIKTGLVHLVVLSGLNVGILAGCFWWLSKKAGLLHTGRSIACIIATIIFLLAVPASSPTLRAGIMFIIFCLARIFNRRAELLNSIALSAIFLLLIRPIDFLDAGFQLSFAATTGIVLFCPVFYKFLMSLFENMKRNYLYLFLQVSLAALSTGCTAWVAVAPIIAYHFHQVQLLTAIWTVPAAIPATVIIVLGTFKILLNPLLPTLAMGLGFIIDFSAQIFSLLVTIFAKFSLSQIIIGKFSIYACLFCYLLIFLWKFFPFKKLSSYLIYPMLLSLIFVISFSINKYENYNNLQLTVLSVGHGQAVFIKTAGNKNFIIDAGSMSNDIGSKIVNPFLNLIAVDKIDSVFISHDDTDHYNGLPEILINHNAENIYTTPQFITNASSSKTDAMLSDFVRENGFSLSVAPEKISIGKTAITRLWPKDISDANSFTDNESSLVLLFEYAGRKILFCSDITKNIQYQLMNLYPDLDIDIMVTPHHGSGRTNDPAFINYFKPEYLITSCTDARLSSICPQILEHPNSYFTCNSGAISASINSQGKITIETNAHNN